jgi:hypothetical protein
MLFSLLESLSRAIRKWLLFTFRYALQLKKLSQLLLLLKVKLLPLLLLKALLLLKRLSSP